MPPSGPSPQSSAVPGQRAARMFAILALAAAVLATPSLWLALDPIGHSHPALAIASFAMFLLVLPLSLLALILGRHRQASSATSTPSRRHFWMSLAAIALWLLLLALLLPLLASSGRGRARDRAAEWNLRDGLAGLATAYAETTAMPEDRRIEALERFLASQQDLRNPWDRSQPGLHPRLRISGEGEAAALALARQQATTPGQAIFVLSASTSASDPRWLAGAVQTRTMGGILSRTSKLEP